ncbi:MAG TPA: nuclear transport factor 2 family protein [Edaphobacter sp.]|nr:nuclear transport factor 2 family protein [Edaphobacter sp.]
MSLRHRISIATLAFALAFSGTISMASAQQESAPSNTTQIVDKVKTFFAAAGTDDLAKFDSVVTPDFYIYDAGARFNGDSIMALIKTAHATGIHYEWNVTQPDVHVSGDTAWIAYVNEGSVTNASGTQHMKWLESAFLRKEAGSWRIAFLHSTRVPPPPQQDRSN